LGGTQSLHTNSFDEAVGLPTDFSARISRNTQIIVQEESQVTRVVDPLAGSYYVEALTDGIIREAGRIIDEVEALGGMAKAIASGMPKMRIEESAARRQARIDQGLDVIVGVNKYPVESEPEMEVLEVPAAIRDEQVARIRKIKETRDQAAVKGALSALTRCAEEDGNLLEACVAAAAARATVGEISSAMERVFGRYVATTQCISGVYAAAYADSETFAALRKRTDLFLSREGRRPRILLVKMGQDGHDRGIKVVATAFSDLGFDVDLGPLFQTPEEAARMAVENDCHVVGVSTLAAGHRELVPALVSALKAEGAGDILVVVGGIIPPRDHPELMAAGAVAIFGPGTPVIDAANRVMNALETAREDA
jgi:methylmalonyl-CoA mutase